SPCADTLPALLALNAHVEAQSARGARRIPAENFLARPYVTALAPDEMVAGVGFKPLPPEAGSAFVKLGRRDALSISRGTVAAVLERDNGVVRRAQVAAGSVAATPCRLRPVEAVLEGRTLTASILKEAGAVLVTEMIRLAGRRWSTPYKERVMPALLRRALQAAWEGAAARA
ncbi:MAG: xanthine dehydrogenase family protein subunit M, partial [Candidatus Eisenbacteria bacterium]|nr:xanthine dehydrogenase family protein subunit M [Candidatus Eisenbacteria bacterium]